MSSRLANCWKQLAQQRRKAFVSFLTAGDPSIPASLPLMHGLVANGVDIIELGMPFSDPAADGKEIQQSGQRALASGVKLQDIFQLVADFRQSNKHTPIVLMGYYNPILSHSEADFVRQCAEVGVDALIVVDLPYEENSSLRAHCRAAGVDLINLIAPTTNAKRAEQIIKTASGFIYYIGVRGITGSKSTEAAAVATHLASIQKLASVPVVVGFGIRSAQQVRELGELCSGVVVGSCLVEQVRLGLAAQHSEAQITASVLAMVRQLKATD